MQNIELEDKNNTITSRKEGIYLSSIAIFLYVFFILTHSLYSIVLQSYILQFSLLSLVLLLLFFKPINNSLFQFKYTRLDLIWSCSIIVVLTYITVSGVGNYIEHIFIYVTGILFLILAKVNINNFEPSFKLIKVVSVIYAASTLFQYLFTDLFNSIIFPFVPITTQQRTLELINLGYYPGLGLAQPSLSAGCMIIGMGMILSNLKFENLFKRRLDVILLLLLIASNLMVGKRSIFIWGIIAIIFTYYVASSTKEKAIKIIKLFTIFIFAIAIFFITLHYFKAMPFLARVVETINDLVSGDDVTSGRLVLYEAAWDIFKENPLFGIGWGQFIVVTSGQLLSRDLIVHNVYLQLLAETGLVGFFAVITPIMYCYYKTFRAIRLLFNKEEGHNHYMWKIGITFSFYYQTFFILYCLTENPFYSMVYMFIYFLCLAILNSFIVNIRKIKKA